MQLGQVIGALRRQVLLIGALSLVMATLAYLKAKNEPTVYQAGFEILTQPVTLETQIISSLSQETLSSREEIVAVTVDEVRLKLLRSPDLLTPIAEELSAKYPNLSYRDINGGLTIKPEGTDILTVSYTSSNPDLVKDILEKVATTYLQYSLEERQTDIRQGINFVEAQLPQLRQRVDAQQARLQNIRQRNNLVNPETTGQQLSTQISAVEQQQLDTQVQLDELRALYEDLTTELASKPSERATASVLKDNPRYQALLSKLQEIDTQLAQQSVLYLEQSPEIQLLQKQRASLIPLLDREGERVKAEMLALIRELEKRNTALKQSANRLTGQIKQLSVITREYSDIERELTIATDNLNQFLSKREALRIDAAQREKPWRLLTPVGKPQPSAASTNKNAVLGAIVGFMLGCGIALGLDRLSNVLYNYKELKHATKLPLLGVIPLEAEVSEFSPAVNFAQHQVQVASPLTSVDYRLEDEVEASVHWLEKMQGGLRQVSSWVRRVPVAPRHYHQMTEATIQRYKTPLFSESFHSLCTNIRLLSPDRLLNSFVITSAEPAEGKSTVAAHLALAAAVMDQRVLLVDTDLRRPRVHCRMGLMNIYGLTNVLTGELDFNVAIQRSPIEDNLYVLTAGTTPPDPIRLIASQKMEELMEKLHAMFDLVIYDAPPVLGLADSHLVATHTEGVILVAGLGKVKRSIIEQALYDIKVSGNPILGVVANRSKITPAAMSGYYQHYFPTPSESDGMTAFPSPPVSSENSPSKGIPTSTDLRIHRRNKSR